MKRRILIVLFGIGTIAGFGFGTAHALHARAHYREAFERHVAKVCVDAVHATEHPAP